MPFIRRSLALSAALVLGVLLAGAAAVPSAGDPESGWEPLGDGEALISDRAQIIELFAADWTGTWGDILFSISADGRITGAYDFDDGVLVGALVEPYVVGWWCEGVSYTDVGELQFRFVRQADGSVRIDGRWVHGEYAERWNDNWDNVVATSEPDPETRARVAEASRLCTAPFALVPTSGTLDVDDPSTLSGLRPAQEVTAAGAAAAGGGALALVAIATYPTVLLNGTIRSHGERVFGWAAPIRRRVSSMLGAVDRRTPSWLSVTLGLFVALVIAGFIDPRFGFSLGSLRLVGSLALAVVVEQLAFLLIARRLFRRRNPNAVPPTVSFVLGSLVFVVIAVLLTRITGFQPGIVFGLVLGLTFAVGLSRRGEALLSLAASAWALGTGLVGWFGFSALSALSGPDPGFAYVFVLETLSGLAVSGLAALPIALLPLAVLDGGAIWAWRKWVWAIAYVLCVFVFLIVVLPFPASWADVGSFAGWIALFTGYCVLAVGVWALFRFGLARPVPTPSSPSADGPADVSGAP